MSHTNPSADEAGKASSRAKQLAYLVYLQAAFLAASYVVGIWLSTEVSGANITMPEVIEHGVVSSGFAVLTGLVGFLAFLQGRRGVALTNLGLFAVTLVGGTSGFNFLANNSDSTAIALTNLTMMAAVGFGMPITGYSIATLTEAAKGTEREPRSAVSLMIYMALVALALTVIAGSVAPTPAYYTVAVVAHVGFAALTTSLTLGVLLLSVMEGAGSRLGTWVPQKVVFGLLSLASISFAGADGVITIYGGGISYVVIMAEVGVLAYAFLILACGAPIGVWFRRRTRVAASPAQRGF
jgi:hypothetical protein